LAHRSPQLTPEELIKYLLKKELNRVSEFDTEIAQAWKGVKANG
jgi:hypothetical protein